MTSVTSEPGGWSAYNFDADGMRVTYKVPPPSFNAADATSTEVGEHFGLTPPPPGTPQREQWDQMLPDLHFVAPPEQQVIYPNIHVDAALGVTPTATPTSSAEQFDTLNWSGYVNDADYQRYETAEGYYIEPSVSQTCTNAEEVQWSGLGGWNSGALEQNGTANYVPSLSNHQAWWEILPAGIAAVNFSASPGYAFEARTHYVSSSVANFTFVNYHTEEEVEVEVEGTFSSDRSTAEYIVERPATTEGEKIWLYPLADYSGEEMEGFTDGTEISSFPYNTADMYDKEETLLSSVGGLTDGAIFNATYHICGTKTIIKE